MNFSRFISALLLLGLGSLASAQTTTSPRELVGVRHDGPGRVIDSNATFTIGLTRDGGTTYLDSARTTEDVEIRGVIRPEAAHVGQSADVFVVDRINLTSFKMRTQDGVFVDWNGSISALIPYRENVMLTDNLAVDVFTGRLGTSGDHRLFLGYIPTDGVLRYTPTAHRITITEQTVLEQANALFSSTISPNIVQTPAGCISCHVNGGVADGLSLQIFVTSSNSSHLSLNFSQFQSLVNQRGRQLILSKVTGGEGHAGGVVLSASSQEYKDLEQFLLLLEDL
jgi:hypothetical protein